MDVEHLKEIGRMLSPPLVSDEAEYDSKPNE